MIGKNWGSPRKAKAQTRKEKKRNFTLSESKLTSGKEVAEASSWHTKKYTKTQNQHRKRKHFFTIISTKQCATSVAVTSAEESKTSGAARILEVESREVLRRWNLAEFEGKEAKENFGLAEMAEELHMGNILAESDEDEIAIIALQKGVGDFPSTLQLPVGLSLQINVFFLLNFKYCLFFGKIKVGHKIWINIICTRKAYYILYKPNILFQDLQFGI